MRFWFEEKNLADVFFVDCGPMSFPHFDFFGLASSLCSTSNSRHILDKRDGNIYSDGKSPSSKVGIGALLGTVGGLRNSPWYASVVPEGSTAQIAGLQPGDLVIQV